MSKKTKHTFNFIDFLSSFMVTLAVIVGAYFIHLFQQPLSVLNPYPPIEAPMELPEDIIAFALTETIANIPTLTVSPTPSQTSTQTLTPPPTQSLTSTPTVPPIVTPSNTADPQKIIFTYVTPPANVDAMFYTPTPLPIAGYLFEFVMLHEAKPEESPWNSFVSNPILNCNWFGVGGQVFDYHGNPMLGANIKLGGTYPGTDKFIELYTTTTYEHILGDGGYDFKLSDESIAATNAFWVQVIDKDGYAISAKAHFSISGYCNVNLIRIDFKQVK
jgi:hypothetical protein